MSHTHLWVIYIVGAVISTMCSLMGYMLKRPVDDKSMLRAILEFYFDGREPQVTTVLTFSIVWMTGAVYVSDLPIPYTRTIADLPESSVVAFSLGALGEYLGPILIRTIGNGINNLVARWFS